VLAVAITRTLWYLARATSGKRCFMPEANITSLCTRGQSAGAVAAGVIFMGIGHALLERASVVRWLFLVGTLFFCLGVAGLIDPRLLLGFTPEGKKAFPLWVHLTSIAAVLLGFALGIGLLVVVYKAFP
jgi:hypothetical protein